MLERFRSATRWLAPLPVLVALLASGCKRSREEEEARSSRDRAAIAESYRALSFLAQVARPVAGAPILDCNDATLPDYARRTVRSCKHLHTVDAPYLERLFGQSASDASGAFGDDDGWMRRRAFAQLLPLDRLATRVDELKVSGALRGLDRDFVGVFVRGAASTADRFVGGFVLVDTAARESRCQVPLDVDYAPLFKGEARAERQRRFFRIANLQIQKITKNFCLD